MGVIAGQVVSCASFSGFGNVWTELEFVGLKQGTIAHGSGFVRVVRWTPGEEEEKGLF